jgi:hypothetical protein
MIVKLRVQVAFAAKAGSSFPPPWSSIVATTLKPALSVDWTHAGQDAEERFNRSERPNARELAKRGPPTDEDRCIQDSSALLAIEVTPMGSTKTSLALAGDIPLPSSRNHTCSPRCLLAAAE